MELSLTQLSIIYIFLTLPVVAKVLKRSKRTVFDTLIFIQHLGIFAYQFQKILLRANLDKKLKCREEMPAEFPQDRPTLLLKPYLNILRLFKYLTPCGISQLNKIRINPSKTSL